MASSCWFRLARLRNLSVQRHRSTSVEGMSAPSTTGATGGNLARGAD